MDEQLPLIILRKIDQPDENAWLTIEHFVKQWNEKPFLSKFFNENGFEWIINLSSNNEHDAWEPLIASLRRLQRNHGIIYHEHSAVWPSVEEVEKEPLIGILGDGYSDKFLCNEKRALSPIKPCTTCGMTNPQYRKYLCPFVIEETYLHKNIHPNIAYDPPGLDLVNLPNGALLISNRVVAIFEKMNVKGYTLDKVLVNKTNKPSKELFLLKANKSIIFPCKEHSSWEEYMICKECGRGKGIMLTPFYVQENWLEGDSIFANSPLSLANIVVTNELYHHLKDAKIRGLNPFLGMKLCSH